MTVLGQVECRMAREMTGHPPKCAKANKNEVADTLHPWFSCSISLMGLKFSVIGMTIIRPQSVKESI